MLNVALALSDDEPDRQEKLEIALAFHDLTIFPTRTMNYLETAVTLALDHLKSIDRTAWEEEVSLMIMKHHRLRKYTGPHANLVDAFRRADWTDVSLGLLRHGLPSAWVKSLHQALPLYSFPRAILGIIFTYGLRNPLRPLPNFRG